MIATVQCIFDRLNILMMNGGNGDLCAQVRNGRKAAVHPAERQ